MEAKTLAHVLNPEQLQQQGSSTDLNTPIRSFNTFITVYSIQLAHSFLDETEASTIEVNKIERIAERSLGCSIIALNTWQKFEQQRTPGLRTQMRRTA